MRASRSSARCRRRPVGRELVADEVEGEVVGGPTHPDAVGGVHRAGHVERRHRRLEPAPRLVERLAAEQVVVRDADVIEREARRLVAARAHLVLDLEDLEAGRAALDDERAVPVAAEGRVDRRPHDDPLGARRVRAEHLLPGEHPLVALLAGAGLDPGDVAAGARLGHRHRPPAGLRVVGEHLQEALALLGRRRRAQRRAAEAGAGQRQGDAAVPVGGLLADEEVAHRLPVQRRRALLVADQPRDDAAPAGADQVELVVDRRRRAPCGRPPGPSAGCGCARGRGPPRAPPGCADRARSRRAARRSGSSTSSTNAATSSSAASRAPASIVSMLRLAEALLGEVVDDEAVAAEQLDAEVGRQVGGLDRLQPRLGRPERGVGLVAVDRRGRVAHREPGAVHAGRGVRRGRTRCPGGGRPACRTRPARSCSRSCRRARRRPRRRRRPPPTAGRGRGPSSAVHGGSSQRPRSTVSANGRPTPPDAWKASDVTGVGSTGHLEQAQRVALHRPHPAQRRPARRPLEQRRCAARDRRP